METNAESLLWLIYQDIGRSNASMGMTKAQKEDFVVTLREAADELEKQVKDDKDGTATDPQ